MKTVITYGVFDLFHEGHEKLLERAKALGDRLIAGVTTDQYAEERGKLIVVEPLEKRLDNVRACPYVDEVIVEDHFGQKAEDIEKYGADIFAIGDDWLGKFDSLEALCEVVYLKRTPNISSSLLRTLKYPCLNLGIIGSGRIVMRFMREVGYLREIRVSGIYNPHLDRSASLRNFLSVYTAVPKMRTVEKLFDQCDAVYIASPHETHYAYAKAALEAGRHVLCEKPMALSRPEAEELFALADEKGLVLMEAVKTAYCPGFTKALASARSGRIGRITDVDAAFTHLIARGGREWEDASYGGSFLEQGSYGLLPVVKLLGTEDLELSFSSVLEPNGIDRFTRLLIKKGGMTASVRTGIGVKTEGQLIISGTLGYVIVHAPWWQTRSFEIRYEDPSRRDYFEAPFEGDGLRYEIADFLYRIEGYGGRGYKLRPEESIAMAGVMESFLKLRGESGR